MPVFFNDYGAQRVSQWNTRQRERRQFAVPSFGKEGLGVAKREEGAMRGAQ